MHDGLLGRLRRVELLYLLVELLELVEGGVVEIVWAGSLIWNHLQVKWFKHLDAVVDQESFVVRTQLFKVAKLERPLGFF